MGISVRNRAIFVEKEATYGTAETLVGADAVQVQNLTFNPAEAARMIPREIIRGSLQPEQEVYAGSLMGFQFDVELKGSGAAGTAPRLGDLLQACGFSETVSASTSVTYEPDSDLSTHEGVTIGYKEGANYRIAKGCRGNCTINLESGMYGKITFTMMGHISAESETSAPTASFESTIPPAFLDAGISIGGAFAPKIQSLAIDMQNEVAPGEDPNEADGYGPIYITGRNTQMTMNPEAEDISDYDFIDDYRSGTTFSLTTGAVGAADNQWTISFPDAYIKAPAQGDRNSLLTWDLTLGAVEDSGDDEISIVFT